MNALLVLLPLATKGPDPADVKPGWLGFSVFLALAAATLLLWLSFRKQLKKIDFVEDDDTDPGGTEPGDGRPEDTSSSPQDEQHPS